MSKEKVNNDLLTNELIMNSTRIFVAIGDFEDVYIESGKKNSSLNGNVSQKRSMPKKNKLDSYSKMLKILDTEDVADELTKKLLLEKMIFDLGISLAEKKNVIVRVVAKSEHDLLLACGVASVDPKKLELVLVNRTESNCGKVIENVEYSPEILDLLTTLDHTKYRELAQKLNQHIKKGADMESFPGIGSKIIQVGLIIGCTYGFNDEVKMLEPVDEVNLIVCTSKPDEKPLPDSNIGSANKIKNEFDFYRAIALKSRTRLSYRSLHYELALVES